MSHLNWEIPSSINLEGFLEKYPPEFKYNIDHFYHIIEYLTKGMDQEDLDNNEGFINMSSRVLQKSIRNYKQYLNHLLDYGLIKSDKKYIVGEKCFGYLIQGYPTHKATVKEVPVQSFVMKKNRAKDFNEKKIKLKLTEKKYPNLTKWFNSKLVIDVEKATNKVEELFPEQTGSIRGKRKGKPSIWNQRFKAIYSIHKFAKQEFYYSVDDNVGRFHSNLTNIKKEVRNYITYDSQKLVNIDIKNCQPLLSTLLFNINFYKNNSQIINIYNIPTCNLLLSNTFTSYSSSIIMLVKTIQKTDNEKIKEYVDMINTGEFYKKISDKLYPNMPFDKQKIKEMIFTVFFSNNRFIGQTEAKSKRAFKDNFLEIYKLFKQIKVANHRALAHILQRIESELIIQKVSKRIFLEKPDLPIFTIHDSVATTVGNEDYVSSILMEEAKKLTGLNIKLGLEYWDY
ncbi:hypothetical protein OAB20_00280 [Winogradskyella sp.]|nr:hypothetical protein [Winogradskyella sp.]